MLCLVQTATSSVSVKFWAVLVDDTHIDLYLSFGLPIYSKYLGMGTGLKMKSMGGRPV